MAALGLRGHVEARVRSASERMPTSESLVGVRVRATAAAADAELAEARRQVALHRRLGDVKLRCTSTFERPSTTRPSTCFSRAEHWRCGWASPSGEGRADRRGRRPASARGRLDRVLEHDPVCAGGVPRARPRGSRSGRTGPIGAPTSPRRSSVAHVAVGAAAESWRLPASDLVGADRRTSGQCTRKASATNLVVGDDGDHGARQRAYPVVAAGGIETPEPSASERSAASTTRTTSTPSRGLERSEAPVRMAVQKSSSSSASGSATAIRGETMSPVR